MGKLKSDKRSDKKSDKKSKKNSDKASKKSRGPLVGIVMGSDSDWPVLEAAHTCLDDFGIPHEVSVISAHRTPDLMLNYAIEAQERGLKVLIAAAGGAAHLPGMIASATTLPVIGVPINITKMDGVDAFLSIVQMPRGVPVASVGIDNALNAGLLAVRILSGLDSKFGSELTKQLEKYQAKSRVKVAKANKGIKSKTK